jgi:hypothetical protein
VTSAGRLALALAAMKLALHLATLGSYGYFRDELYYLACTEHLAWGYVDHPPLSIAVLAGWRAFVGDGLEALHVLPAIIGAAIVWVGCRLVIALGGGRLAVIVAGVAMIAAPARLGFDHNVSMNGLDALFWVLAALFVVRAHASDARRDWLTLGVVLGLGLLDKWSVLWLGAGLAVALVATPWRAVLRRPGPWIAAAVAMLLFVPNLAWQATHEWPTLEFMDNALREKYVRLPPGELAIELVMLAGPASAPVWIAGVIAPFVVPALARARPIAIVFVTAVAIVVLTRGKPEYLAAPIALPVAAGAVAIEHGLARMHARWRGLVVGALALAQLGIAAVVLPLVIPILPVPRYIAYAEQLGVAPGSSEHKELGALPQYFADMHGWPELVDEAEHAWSTLSPDEREHAVIWAVTGGYGPAAAIDVLGRARGLPKAISTHNSYWTWGWHDADGSVVVMLGGPADRLAPLFASFEQTGTVRCAPCMPYEDDKPVYVGRGMKRSFAELWPQLKHFE